MTEKFDLVNRDDDDFDDKWQGPTKYERDLTEENFNLFTKALVNLPFTKTDDDVEPNMITIRNKKHISQHPYMQIWRNTDEDCVYTVSCSGHTADPTTIKLNKKMYNGNFMIEMSCGVDCVNPDDHQ